MSSGSEAVPSTRWPQCSSRNETTGATVVTIWLLVTPNGVTVKRSRGREHTGAWPLLARRSAMRADLKRGMMGHALRALGPSCQACSPEARSRARKRRDPAARENSPARLRWCALMPALGRPVRFRPPLRHHRLDRIQTTSCDTSTQRRSFQLCNEHSTSCTPFAPSRRSH